MTTHLLQGPSLPDAHYELRFGEAFTSLSVLRPCPSSHGPWPQVFYSFRLPAIAGTHGRALGKNYGLDATSRRHYSSGYEQILDFAAGDQLILRKSFTTLHLRSKRASTYDFHQALPCGQIPFGNAPLSHRCWIPSVRAPGLDSIPPIHSSCQSLLRFSTFSRNPPPVLAAQRCVSRTKK